MLALTRSFRLAVLAAPLLATSAAAQTWRDVAPPGGPFDRIRQVALHPADADHLVTRTHDAVHETIDGGQSWTQLDTSSLPGAVTALTLTIDGELYVGVRRALAVGPTGGLPLLYRRTGTGWVPFGPDVLQSPATTEPVWLASNLAVGRGDSDLMVLLAHEGSGFEYGGQVQYFTSDDGGATWSGPTHHLGGDPWSLEILERAQGPAVLSVVAEYPSTGTISGLYRSTTWGAPVEYVESTDGNYDPTTSRTEPGRVYVARTSDFTFNPSTLLLSDDLGSTWAAFGAPDYYWSPRVGAVAPHLFLRSITSAFSSTGAIEISWDGAVTWQALPDPPPTPGVAGSAWELELAHDDSRIYAWNNTSKIFAYDLVESTGVPECSAQSNATGRAASIRTFGSPSIASDDVRIHIDSVPAGTATLLLASMDAGFVVGPGGSFGDLCLGGSIGRFGVTTALPTAEAFFDVPVTGLPTPTGRVSALPGETWRFQAWFRDNAAGVPGSNFSDAVALTYLP